MYIITYRKYKSDVNILPFKNLSSLNNFIKLCVNKNWKVIEIRKQEEI